MRAVSPGDSIAVWFSRGAASAVAAKTTLELYGETCDVRVVTNPVIEEDEDNDRFQHDVEQWLGVEIETALNSKYPNASCIEVWDDRQYMSGVNGAPCTEELKKRARQEWEEHNPVDWHVLGYTAEEQERHDNFILTERENLLPVLIDAGLSKQDCGLILMRAGIKLPRVYTEKSDFGDGYPNANCIGCVKATSPTYWNHVRQTRPEIFKLRAEQSRRIGAKLVRVPPSKLPFCFKDANGFWWDISTGDCLTKITKSGKKKTEGVRLFLDELDPTVRARSMKTMTIECGVFCEEHQFLTNEDEEE